MTVAVAPLYFQNGRPAEINSTEHTVSIPAVSISGTLTLDGNFASTGQSRVYSAYWEAGSTGSYFQHSTTNAATSVTARPNGTGTVATWYVVNSSAATNCATGYLSASSATISLGSSVFGSGTCLPMTFTVNGSERSRINTDGGYIHSGANTTRAGTTISGGFGGNHIVWAGKDLNNSANDTSIASVLNVVGTSSVRNQIVWYAQREAAGGGGDEWQEVTWRQAFCVDSSPQMGLVWVGGGSASFMNGSVGIGHWGATFPTSDNTWNNGNASYRWAAIYAANGTIQTSDRRLKKDVDTISGANAIAFVNALRPVTYKWKDGGADIFYEKDADGKQLPPREVRRAGRRIHSGFIAQEVKDVIDAQPGVAEAVWTKEDYDADNKPTQGLAYAEFIAPVVAALQAALAKIEALEARVTALGG